jgi:putative restriction endonuclease
VSDEDVRSSCFNALAVLCAQFGEDIPYVGGLDRGFAFRGRRVPFLNYQKGIYRAAVQRGPAALSVNTSYKSPYDDAELEFGFLYAYRAGSVEQADNRALRAAFEQRVPIVYFVGTRPGWYKALFPCYVVGDDPSAGRVVISVGEMAGPLDDQEALLLEDPLERRYAVREARVRLHQARFRGLVLNAYANTCAICRLKEGRLLDAAHIVADADEDGVAAVSNGLSLCTIHHRAYDQNLVGVDESYTVSVSKRLLDEDDGPMLDLLKGSHGAPITLPKRRAWHPRPEFLAARYSRFVELGG